MRGINLNYHIHTRETCVADSKTSFSVSSPGDLRGRSHRGSELDVFAGGLGLCQRLYDSLTLSGFQAHPGAQLHGAPFIRHSALDSELLP